jgi:hypothetical protein
VATPLEPFPLYDIYNVYKPTFLKEKNMEKQKEYNLCYLFVKVRNTLGKVSDRLRHGANKCNKNLVGRLPTLEQNWKIILSEEV